MRLLPCVAIVATVTLSCARSELTSRVGAIPETSLTTQERMYASGFWPTKGDMAASEYAGEAACMSCHSGVASLQHQTPMYHAAIPASRLVFKAPLTFQEGSLAYSVEQSSSGATYSANSLSRGIAWAFGNAETGQTYLLRQEDRYTESRLSYYTAPNALDITVGHSAQTPSSLQSAFGHELTFDTAQRCFACHTTASTVANVFVPEKAIPGVTCEACHGPGAAHVASAKAATRGQRIVAVTNPASLSPSDSVDFCGSCHRTFSDVASSCPRTLARSRSGFSLTV